MKVKVIVNNDTSYDISCGNCKQTIRWLSLIACERYCESQKPRGKIRQREKRNNCNNNQQKQGRFMPMEVRVNGLAINPQARLKDVLKTVGRDEMSKFVVQTEFGQDLETEEEEEKNRLLIENENKTRDLDSDNEEDETYAALSGMNSRSIEEKKEEKSSEPGIVFHVKLATEMQVGVDGVPTYSKAIWRDLAFGHSKCSKERMKMIKEKQNLENEHLRSIEDEKRQEENKKIFLTEIGEIYIKGESDLTFYSENEDLGVTAIRDWKLLRPVFEKMLNYDTLEITSIRKTIFLNYRLLRDAYKLYSGLGNDKMNKMSFAELMYLLQDTQVCEVKDSDIVARLITPILLDQNLSIASANMLPQVPPPKSSSSSSNNEQHQDDSSKNNLIITTLPTNEINMNREQFLGCFTKIFISEEMHKLHLTREGNFTDAGAKARTASLRFREFMKQYIVPFLESKTCTHAVKNALADKDIIRFFANNVVDLKRVYKKASTLTHRKNSGNRAIQRQMMQSKMVKHFLDIHGYLSFLQKLEFIETTDKLNDDNKETKKLETFTKCLSQRIDGIKVQVHVTKLNYADAKSLFSASQFENEDIVEEEDSTIEELSFKEFIESIVRLTFKLFDNQNSSSKKLSLKEKLQFVVNACNKTFQ